MVPITRTRAGLYFASTISLYWAVLLSAGYVRHDSDMPVGTQNWAKDFVWKVSLQGPGVSDFQEISLPRAIQAQGIKTDRIEKVSHSLEFLGLKVFASEAFLWRQDQRLWAWRQYGVPILLIMMLWALAPLIAVAIVIGSIRWVRPGYLVDKITLRVVLGAVGLVVLILSWFVGGYRQDDAVAVARATEGFKGAAWADAHPDGAWTGDVTELYRMGAIRREIAEADAAPLRPLVAKPKPYRGYYFIAMETGLSMSGNSDDPEQLKPGPRTWGNFAFCAFPAKEGPNQRVWLICPTGFFGRRMDGGKPVLRWPSPKEMQQGWGRYCRLEAPDATVRALLALGR